MSPGQGRQGGQDGVLHPLLLGAAAVEQLHAAGGQQLLAVDVQRLVVDAAGRLLVAQAQHAVRLAGAHLLHQPDVRPVPLVVPQGTEGIDEVFLLAVHVFAEKASAPGDGVQQQLAQHGGHRLKELLAAGREGVVDEPGGEAHALALALLADGVVHRCAVEGVQRGGQALHVRAAHRTAAQHGGQQRVGGGRLPAQASDKVQRQAAGFEFTGGQIRQEHVLHDLPTVFIHRTTSVLRYKHTHDSIHHFQKKEKWGF